MNIDELIRFNPILAKALAEADAQAVEECGPEILKDPYFHTIIAASVQSGIGPDMIYAMIKTGRIVTKQNMKLLTKADIKEWQDACLEYGSLSGTETSVATEHKAMPKTYMLTLKVTVKDELQAIEAASKLISPDVRIACNRFIEDIEDALLELAESNPLLEEAGVEVVASSAGLHGDEVTA
jgi:hypothetical protein